MKKANFFVVFLLLSPNVLVCSRSRCSPVLIISRSRLVPSPLQHLRFPLPASQCSSGLLLFETPSAAQPGRLGGRRRGRGLRLQRQRPRLRPGGGPSTATSDIPRQHCASSCTFDLCSVSSRRSSCRQPTPPGGGSVGSTRGDIC